MEGTFDLVEWLAEREARLAAAAAARAATATIDATEEPTVAYGSLQQPTGPDPATQAGAEPAGGDQAATGPGQPGAHGPRGPADAHRLYRARAYVDRFDPAVSGNDGSGQTFDAACSLIKGFDLSINEARPILQDYSARCEPPWSDAEIEHKLTSADDKPDDKPRGYLFNAPRQGAGGNGNGAAAPDWAEIGNQAADAAAEAAVAARQFANFFEEAYDDNGEMKIRKVPRRMGELDQALRAAIGRWPKRVEETTLFWGGADYDPVYLDSATRLFAWIDRWCQLNWLKGPLFVTQERFYEHLRMTADNYEAIETLPHWPQLPDTYYMHQPVLTTGTRTGKLEAFLEKFCPSTETDRELIKALILTLFWGGPPGRRPAFLIKGPDRDIKQGRGVGKSTIVDVIADELVGGSIDVSLHADIENVKTRLLSDSARRIRVARLDNVKTNKFSWPDLEGLITASEISGKALYRGEGRRPNTLTWCITLNSANLSKDMAQRVIPIRLSRPLSDAEWENDIKAFAQEYRWDIIRDIGILLEREPGPLMPQTRWANWEKYVLSKTDLPEHCQDMIGEQQGSLDEDDGERDLVTEKFRDEIHARVDDITKDFLDPDRVRVFIPSLLAAQWLNEEVQIKLPTNRASAYIAGLGISELTKKSYNAMRGWLWHGVYASPRKRIVDLSGKLDEEQLEG